MHKSRWAGVVVAVAVAVVVGLGVLGPFATTDEGPANASIPRTEPTPTTTPHAATGRGTVAAPPGAKQVLSSMTLRQQVGQLLMLGVPASYSNKAEMALLRRYHVGSVVLLGGSTRGVTGTAQLTHRLHGASTAAAGLMVTVDQEGGAVQHLQGPGFDTMPSALTMGGWSLARVRSGAIRWGNQLKRAGVDVDLAPVLDVVPASMSTANRPIGSLHREFGHTPLRVQRKGGAFASGLAHDAMGYALKHFPGLGRVRGNTDFVSGVTDRVTTRHDPDLAPFAHVIDAHAPIVLISTARYTRIDKHHPAVFSHTILTGMLRNDLKFGGVILSDSLSGAQLANRTPASRAVQFIGAGGDLALTTTWSDVAKMSNALVQDARQSSDFRALVRAAALHVLRAKQRYHLLTANPG